MRKYIRKFNNHNEYEAFTATTEFVKPNVSFCEQENDVHYNPAIKVTSVTLDKGTLSLSDGDTDTLVATVLPNDASNKNVTWLSSDSTVASVDSNGVVSGVSAGNANITVTTVDGGFTAQCVTNVKSYKTITYTASAKLSETTSTSRTGLHTNAFSGASGQQLTIVSHTFEDGVGTITFNGTIKTVGSYAFYDCSGLTSIDIPNSVTSIGSYAFQSCSDLTSIDIPSGVTSIGHYAFKYCTSLISITIEAATPPTLGTNVFYNTNNCPIYVPACSVVDTYRTASVWSAYSSRIAALDCPSITAKFNVTSTSDPTRILSSTTNVDKVYIDGAEQPSVTTGFTFNSLGEHIVEYRLKSTSIGDGTFSRCSGLTSIDIPDSVTSIGTNAFYYCFNLTSIAIPDSVTSIGASAFSYCHNVTSIAIPDSVTSIGSYAFQSCSGLTSIDIPSSVTSIGDSAFRWCSGLTSVTIPSGVTSIGNYTFQSCTGLTSIDIPSGVTSIGTAAFNSCSSLTSIDIPSGVTSIGEYAFAACSGLTSIDIPSGVTSIGESTFNRCRSLTSIDIPSGVTSIGQYAFVYCTSLTSIISNATTAPTIQSGTFQDIASNGTLYVPTSSTGYDVWMGTSNYYLGKYNWTKVEQ